MYKEFILLAFLYICHHKLASMNNTIYTLYFSVVMINYLKNIKHLTSNYDLIRILIHLYMAAKTFIYDF